MSKFALIAFFLLCSTLGFAQLPGGNVFFGYSYLNAEQPTGNRANQNGWEASVEGKVFPLLSIVGDVSGHYGSENFPVFCPATISFPCHMSSSTHSFMAGPRISISVAKFRPFAHILIGGSHISGSTTGVSASDTSFAWAVGGGLDYHLAPLISWRIQADSLQTRFFSSTQTDARISTGIVVHF